MKKMFTLLFSLAMLTSAFAQYDPKDDWNRNKGDGYSKDDKHRHDNHDDRFNGGFYFSPRERDMQIEQINREYDYKIQSVKNKYFMSWYQKKRQIEFLKDQRDKEIRMVYARFNDRRNKYNDRDRRDRRNW
jgi:hypothetical protein